MSTVTAQPTPDSGGLAPDTAVTPTRGAGARKLPIALGVRAVLEGRARAAVVWLVLALLFEEETAPIVGAAGA